MDIQKALFIIKKHLKMIMGVTVAFLISGVIISKFIISPKYEANALLVINADQSTLSSVVTYDQVNTAQELVNTCAVILKSDTVLNQVIQNVNLNITAEQLMNNVNISGVNQTQVLNITVKYSDSQTAASIANSISDLAPDILIKTINASSVEIVSPAKPNDVPVSPKIPLIAGLSFALGLILSIVLSFFLELLDNSYVNEEEIQAYLDLPVLCVIPSCKNKKVELRSKKVETKITL